MRGQLALLLGTICFAACSTSTTSRTDRALKLANECVNTAEYAAGGECTCFDAGGKPSSGCVKMPITCPDQPQEPTPTVLSNPTLVPYTSTMPLVADYTTCAGKDGGTGGSDGGSCKSGPAYDASIVTYVAEYVDAKSINVYTVPAGATWVVSPTGNQLFPLLPPADGFANPTRAVTFGGKLWNLNQQNDCRITADGCRRCTTC